MPQAPRTWIRAGDRRQPRIIGVPRTLAVGHAGGTPRQNRSPLRSSKRLPGTSVSLPGITLSDEGGQGERARTRRYAWSSASWCSSTEAGRSG
jgi:hypothetical protein